MMMAKEATTCMIVFALLLLCVSVPIVVSVEPEVDFHYLVASWPPSFCNNTENKARKVCFLPNLGFRYEEFSIHGMWPQKGGQSVGNCSNKGSPYVNGDMTPLQPTLDKLWPDFKASTERMFWVFWKSEWDKHGRCSGLEQKKYFQVAVDRFQEQDLEKILRLSGIRPNSKVTVKLSKIAAAFTSKGVIPVIHCNDNKITKAKQLFEVYLCVEADGSKIVPCGTSVSSKNCGGSPRIDPDILYPVYDPKFKSV